MPDDPTKRSNHTVAWLFDLDDTLVSSAPVWRIAEEELLEKLGAPYDARLAVRYRGLNAEGVARAIYRSIPNPRIDEIGCVAFLRSRLVELARTKSLEIDGASKLLGAIAGRYRIAIASGSPRGSIDAVVERFGWDRFVELTVSSEEVPAGKPAPDVYLETARRLGVLPDECIVVEDSLHGLTSAVEAGMRCIVVPSVDLTREIDAGAYRVYRSLGEIDLDDFLG